jgi:hypothetical protein
MPAVWTSTRMTTCPNTLQCVAVSTTTSPVRHTAEVAVKRAVNQSVGPPVALEIGSTSRTAPARMRPANV